MVTVVKDELPRLITFPIGEIHLRQELGGALPEDGVGMFFLYLSGVQVNHYDPVTSKRGSYPVLALDRSAPQLCADRIARLLAERREKRQLVDDHLAGVARAEAQLRGGDEELEEDTLGDEFAFDFSVMLFPVKTRLRRKVEDAILDYGIRPLKNWLTAPCEARRSQRPLVLIYDEETARVTAKFSEAWTGAKQAHIYR